VSLGTLQGIGEPTRMQLGRVGNVPGPKPRRGRREPGRCRTPRRRAQPTPSKALDSPTRRIFATRVASWRISGMSHLRCLCVSLVFFVGGCSVEAREPEGGVEGTPYGPLGEVPADATKPEREQPSAPREPLPSTALDATASGVLALTLSPSEIVGTIADGETKTVSAPASTHVLYRALETTLKAGETGTFSIGVPVGLEAVAFVTDPSGKSIASKRSTGTVTIQATAAVAGVHRIVVREVRLRAFASTVHLAVAPGAPSTEWTGPAPLWGRDVQALTDCGWAITLRFASQANPTRVADAIKAVDCEYSDFCRNLYGRYAGMNPGSLVNSSPEVWYSSSRWMPSTRLGTYVDSLHVYKDPAVPGTLKVTATTTFTRANGSGDTYNGQPIPPNSTTRCVATMPF
jgi:hypothetical protein